MSSGIPAPRRRRDPPIRRARSPLYRSVGGPRADVDRKGEAAEQPALPARVRGASLRVRARSLGSRLLRVGHRGVARGLGLADLGGVARVVALSSASAACRWSACSSRSRGVRPAGLDLPRKAGERVHVLVVLVQHRDEGERRQRRREPCYASCFAGPRARAASAGALSIGGRLSRGWDSNQRA